MPTITPLGPNLGADITDVDLANLSDPEFQLIRQAWLEFSVIRIRNQPLNDSQLQSFSSGFGPLEDIPLGRMSEAQRRKLPNRYVTVISNIKEHGKPIGGLGNSEAAWHSDMTYVENPPPASVLLGVEIPTQGGDTFFASQHGAFDALPSNLRDQIADFTIKHDAAHNSVGGLRYGFDSFEDPRQAPGASHPILMTHEETGRPCLYLGRREFASVPGLSLEQSESLLDEIWTYAALPENVWCQRWQAGDVVVWDNRAVLHRRDGFPADARRMMRRCQVLSH